MGKFLIWRFMGKRDVVGNAFSWLIVVRVRFKIHVNSNYGLSGNTNKTYTKPNIRYRI